MYRADAHSITVVANIVLAIEELDIPASTQLGHAPWLVASSNNALSDERSLSWAIKVK